MLDKITTGKRCHPLLLLLYGISGIGKSSFASQSERPIFLGAEEGTLHLDVSRFPKITKYSELLAAISDLRNKQHEFKTLVLDTIDSIEPIVHKEICSKYNSDSIEKACGGYGKGYVKAQEMFMDLRDLLDDLRHHKQMNIIILAHSHTIKFNDPSLQMEYDRHELKLHKRAVPVFTEWVDNLLFANFESFKTTNDKGNEQTVSTGNRIIFTEDRPAYKAKNRFSLPENLPLSYPVFFKEVQKFFENGNSFESLKKDVLELRKRIPEQNHKFFDEQLEACTTLEALQKYKIRVLRAMED